MPGGRVFAVAWYGNSGTLPLGTPPSEESRVDAHAVRAELGRVLATPMFTKSKRCTSLLVYIVERTLDGAQDLKERDIGIEVFGRAPDYDTSQDPTVRVAVAEVRKRLSASYSQTGIQHELRIELPAHSYLAEFSRPKPNPVGLKADPPEIHGQKHYNKLWRFALPLALVLIALGAWGTYRVLAPASALDKFWAPVLASSNPVLLCVGSPPLTDSAAAALSNSPGSGQAGMSFAAFANKPGAIVAMSDVTAANDLALYFRSRNKESSVYPALNLDMWKLQSNPVVIFGVFNNYWATKLGANLRFRFNRESASGKRWVEDADDPGERRWSLDMSAPMDQVDSDYAVISRVLDQTTGQWWVGVAGLTGVGTVAAHELVIDPNTMAEASSGFPRGWEKKSFQIVLGVKLVQGNAGTVRVLATDFR